MYPILCVIGWRRESVQRTSIQIGAVVRLIDQWCEECFVYKSVDLLWRVRGHFLLGFCMTIVFTLVTNVWWPLRLGTRQTVYTNNHTYTSPYTIHVYTNIITELDSIPIHTHECILQIQIINCLIYGYMVDLRGFASYSIVHLCQSPHHFDLTRHKPIVFLIVLVYINLFSLSLSFSLAHPTFVRVCFLQSRLADTQGNSSSHLCVYRVHKPHNTIRLYCLLPCVVRCPFIVWNSGSLFYVDLEQHLETSNLYKRYTLCSIRLSVYYNWNSLVRFGYNIHSIGLILLNPGHFRRHFPA